MWQAIVIVKYKEGILDPEAKTIQHALDTLGYKAVTGVETGKYFEVTLDGKLSRLEAEQLVREFSTKLLSNPVVQHFTMELREVKP